MSDYILSIGKVAQALGLSTNTLKRWYKWYENPDFEKPEGLELPCYETDSRGTKFFRFADVAVLQKFHEDLQGKYKGCMAEFNAYWQWGQRGTRILNSKKEEQ